MPKGTLQSILKRAAEDMQEAIAELLEGPSPDPSLNDGNLDYTYKYDLKSKSNESKKDFMTWGENS